MRILFLSTSGQLGGAERALLDVLAALRSAHPDWPLTLMSVEDGPLVGEAAALGADTAVRPLPPGFAAVGESGRPHSRVLVDLARVAWPVRRYVKDLARWISARGADIVHSNGLKAHVLAALARPGTPLVWHLHDYVGARGVTSRLLRLLSRRCAHVVVNSRSVGEDAVRVLGNRVPLAVVHNAVDLEKFRPGGPAADLDQLAGLEPAPPGTVRIGLVATFARWKGHDVFLRAIAALPRELPVRAYVVGGPLYQTDGSQWQRAELEAMAASLDLQDRVGFTGFVNDTSTAMRALDVVVHASTAPEPFGLVIAEAMACGRAVIVSDAGGAAEIIDAGVDAMPSPPGDAAALARRLEALAGDAGRRESLGAQAAIHARARFAPSRLAGELERVYRTLVQPT